MFLAEHLLNKTTTRNAGLAAIAAVVRLLLHVRATPQPPSWHVPAAGVWAALRRLNAALALDLSPFGAREANAAWKVLDEHGVAVRRAELCTRGSPLPRIPISDLEPNRAVVSRPQADGEPYSTHRTCTTADGWPGTWTRRCWWHRQQATSRTSSLRRGVNSRRRLMVFSSGQCDTAVRDCRLHGHEDDLHEAPITTP